MAKLRTNAIKKNTVPGIVKLKFVVEKLHKSLLHGNKNMDKSPSPYDDFEDYTDSPNVPEDVKEGHFAVIAVQGDEPQRFVLPLSCLTHPRFVRLLEEAAEEYGFDHEGALAIPCGPTELERILAEHNDRQWQANGRRGRRERRDSSDGLNRGWFL